MCATGHPAVASVVGSHPRRAGGITTPKNPLWVHWGIIPPIVKAPLLISSKALSVPLTQHSSYNPGWQHILPIDYDYLCQFRSLVLKISRILAMLTTKPQMMRLPSSLCACGRRWAPCAASLSCSYSQREWERRRNKEEAKKRWTTAVRTTEC